MSLARRLLLAASTNAWLRERATTSAIVRRSVSAFMPGEHLDDAVSAAVGQQSLGVATIFTRLGENLTRADEAEAVTEHYLDVLDRVQADGLRAHVSVKPTQLGLDLDAALCARNLETLLDRAALRDGFIWLDMEGSSYVDQTLGLYRRARDRSSRVGVALQAYLYRTPQDVEALWPLGGAIRLVKGAYLEPSTVAFPNKADVDRRYFELAARLLEDDVRRAGGVLHVATHDERLVDRVAQVVDERNVPASAYEYAMLYGIGRRLQQRLVEARRPLRVLISYGEHWFPWYMRRLAERPANVGFVVKNVFR
jgi:proline dehydrogenase